MKEQKTPNLPKEILKDLEEVSDRDQEQQLLEELESLLSTDLRRKLDEVIQRDLKSSTSTQEQLSAKLKKATRNTFLERGADFLLNLTDALYPIFIGAWAVIASSQTGSLLHLFGAMYTGFNGGAMHKIVPEQLGVVDVLIRKRKYRRAKLEMVEARAMLNQSLSNIIFIGVALGVTLVFFAKPLLHWLGITHPDAVGYFQLAGGSYFLFTGIRWNLASHLRCVDRIRFATRAALLMFGLNLILDPLLIFAVGWGLWGSALGTLTAQIVGICYMFHCIRRESVLWGIKASWCPTWSIQHKLWVNPGGLTMVREVSDRLFSFFLVYLINRELGAGVLMFYRLWTTMYPPIASVGLAAGTNMQVRVAQLIGKVQEIGRSWPEEAVSVRLAPYRQEFERELEICRKDCHALLVKRWFWAALVMVSFLTFVYLPRVNAGSQWYLLIFFTVGLFGWYCGSMGSLLEYTLHGAGKLKVIIVIQFCNNIGTLLATWGLMQLFSKEYMNIIVVAAMYSISRITYGALLHRVSKTVLCAVK